MLRNYIHALVPALVSRDFHFDNTQSVSALYAESLRAVNTIRTLYPSVNPYPLNTLKTILLRSLLQSKDTVDVDIVKHIFGFDNSTISGDRTVVSVLKDLFEGINFSSMSNSFVVIQMCKSLLGFDDVIKLCISLFYDFGPLEVKPECYPRLFFIIGYLIHEIDLSGAQTAELREVIADFLILHKLIGISVRGEINRDSIEHIAQDIIYSQIHASLSSRYSSGQVPNRATSGLRDRMSSQPMVIATAPVRIDLSGGWSDTPPICYESSGAVLNVAIRVNDIKPICCTAKFSQGFFIHLKNYRIDKTGHDSSLILHEEFICQDIQDLRQILDCHDPNEICSLLKAVLIVLGLSDRSRPYLESGGSLEDITKGEFGSGFEVCCFSGLPAGSGMGGSSVLAAAALAAVARLWGVTLVDDSLLVDMVTAVEQVMSTGGGWQDQIGGIYPGFKIGRTSSGLPLRINCEAIHTSPQLNHIFESRTFVIYTGTQRLAKNTLINALRAYSLNPCCGSPYSIVEALQVEANKCAEYMKTSTSTDLDSCHETVDKLGEYLSRSRCSIKNGNL
jgi:galactokinase/mevalonate kinase-like predicted kinase